MLFHLNKMNHIKGHTASCGSRLLSAEDEKHRPVAPPNHDGCRHRGSTVCDGRHWECQPGALAVYHQYTISIPSWPETQKETANISGIVQVKRYRHRRQSKTMVKKHP